FNGQKIVDASDLRRRIALAQVGSQVSLTIRRGDESRSLTLTVAEQSTQYTYAPQGDEGWVSPIQGIVVEVLDRRTAERSGLRAGTAGVVVREILNHTPAAYSGLQAGDIILEINREGVATVEDFRRLVEKYEGKSVILLVSRAGRLYYLSLPS
ncbi:MAG: PDZ domain-containing protein, partial [Candidatus Zixiibacteriota bacterium]